MGSNVSKDQDDPDQVIIPVKAEKAMRRTIDNFEVDEYGAIWKGMKTENLGFIGVKDGDTIDAIFDLKNSSIEVKALEDAEEKQEFTAGSSEYIWKIDEAPNGGIKKGGAFTLKWADLQSGKAVVFRSNSNKQMEVPSDEFTDVPKDITEICANMSEQIYVASSDKHFILETSSGKKANVIIFDNHNQSNASIPAFAVAVIDKTMICGWRGTNARGTTFNLAFDAVSDLAIGPVVCSELGKARSGIRMQNAMSSFAATELDVHGERIIELIKGHKINEIVFTGHSLGGGIACCAHPILQAQMDGHNDGAPFASKWTKLREDIDMEITLRTVVFSAVMSVHGIGLVFDSSNKPITNELSNQLLKKVGRTTKNLIFGCDVVPRAYSHVEYLTEVLDCVGKEDIPDIINDKTPPLLGSFINGKLQIRENIDKVKQAASEDVVHIINKFRHLGKVLYYKDINATKGNPLVLEDTGPINDQPTNKNHFNHYKFTDHEFKDEQSDMVHITALSEAHSYPKDLIATYVPMTVAYMKRGHFLDEDEEKENKNETKKRKRE